MSLQKSCCTEVVTNMESASWLHARDHDFSVCHGYIVAKMWLKMKKPEVEIERLKRFHSGIMGKRELLSNLKSQIVMRNKKITLN